MDVEKYIASGILELYVAGALDEDQNLEVYQYARQYPEIRDEILAIEAAILELSKSSAPPRSPSRDFKQILRSIEHDPDNRNRYVPDKRIHWTNYSGWAAAVLLAAGLWWVYQQNRELKIETDLRNNEIQVLQDQIIEARDSRDKTMEILSDLRDKQVEVVSLNGQKAAPEAFARAYWNRQDRTVFIDAQGLPEPPPGLVYQLWSLKLSPLTPTSLGLLEDFVSSESKVFTFADPHDSEAFGITLEPEGGSESPTLEQLYTLGTVAS